LVGYEEQKAALDALGVTVVAGSVDDAEKAAEVAADLSFPVAYGMTRADADAMGSWWEDRRSIIQPSEFVLGADGKVMSATYSSGPIGRLDATDVVKYLNFVESKKAGG
jgi:peroxiredoxin